MKRKLLLARNFASFSFLFFFFPLFINAQSLTVTGKITDENSKGVPGVTIRVQGTGKSTISDADGFFKLAGVNGKDVLIFSSVGYQEQEIAVNNQTVINLSLDISQKTLSDVVVIGYGTQKRRNVTGAVSRLKN